MQLLRRRSSPSLPHPPDRVPREPNEIPHHTWPPTNGDQSPRSSSGSLAWSESASDQDAPKTPIWENREIEAMDTVKDLPSNVEFSSNNRKRPRRASTQLIAQTPEDIKRIIGDGETGTRLIEKYCCGGGCCFMETLPSDTKSPNFAPVVLPDNDAFRSLQVKLGSFSLDTELTNIAPLSSTQLSFDSSLSTGSKHETTVDRHPPKFVQPHPPYDVFAAPVYHARELTMPGATKRTFHFDLDITDYPEEGGVDFKVGGAIGICPPNAPEVVDDILDALCIPGFVRDKVITLKTNGGRWPTIWGDEKPRELVTTRRELLTWCSDVQSSPPTKALLRLMAEYADAKNEKKILEYFTSAQGQAAFCDLRTGPHVTLPQLLHAFPSSKPPLPALLSVLPQLMPRFYSLSNDPHVSSSRRDLPAGRRIIEMAVTIHEMPDWRASTTNPASSIRTGVGSGYLMRVANAFAASNTSATSPTTTSTADATSNPPASPTTTHPQPIQIPMFRGLMANPLSREFISDGPMLLIGAGVGMAPFRGFILNRLRTANCANKIWLIQGVRDSALDEIYHGELGEQEGEIKRVVQSRRSDSNAAGAGAGRKRKFVADADGVEAAMQDLQDEAGGQQFVNGEPKINASSARYVQDEVRAQADVVWFVVNSVDGRVFVVGGKGMGDGVELALIDVAMRKGGLNEHEAKEFWDGKKSNGQYIAETW